MQEQDLEATRAGAQINPGMLHAGTMGADETAIDPTTLANLDIALFKCLINIGTPRQRICSALCLSYAEYDYISKHLQEL